MLRLLCKFSHADDAVYPSSLKAACFGLSVPSKFAVIHTPGTQASFHKVKKKTPTVTVARPLCVQCTVQKLTLNPTSFWSFLPYNL